MLLSCSSQVLSEWEPGALFIFPPKLSMIFLSFTNKLQVSQIQALRKISLFSLLASLMFKHHSLLYQKSLILNLSGPKRLTLHPAKVLIIIFYVVPFGLW